MVESIANYGPEIIVKYLKKKVKATKDVLEVHRNVWKKTG